MMRKTLVALGMVMLLLTAFSKYAGASSLPACNDKRILNTVRDLMFKYIVIPKLNKSYWKYGVKFYLTYQNFNEFEKKMTKYMSEYKKNPHSLDFHAKEVLFIFLSVFKKNRPYFSFKNYYIPVVKTLSDASGINENEKTCSARVIILKANDQFEAIYSILFREQSVRLLKVIKLNNSQEQ